MGEDTWPIGNHGTRTQNASTVLREPYTISINSCTSTRARHLHYLEIFLALYPLTYPPEGCGLFRVYGQPHERLCSLPVSVLFRVGSADKSNQEGRDGNRTRLAGSRSKLWSCKSGWLASLQPNGNAKLMTLQVRIYDLTFRIQTVMTQRY